ncbi:MAG: hypothetical protein R2724_31165 [Bryobacterales bacterium]
MPRHGDGSAQRRLYMLHRDADAFGSTPARPAHITEVDTVNLRILRRLPLREGLAFSFGPPHGDLAGWRVSLCRKRRSVPIRATYEQSTIEVVEVASGHIVRVHSDAGGEVV